VIKQKRKKEQHERKDLTKGEEWKQKRKEWEYFDERPYLVGYELVSLVVDGMKMMRKIQKMMMFDFAWANVRLYLFVFVILVPELLL